MDELPLAGIIRNVAEKLSVRCMKHNITINVHADDNIKILGDGDQMVQLIMILCDNALKYSPENGTAEQISFTSISNSFANLSAKSNLIFESF